MANKSWLGTSSGVWDTAGNWSSSGEPAATGDSAFFGSFSTQGVAGSDQSSILLDLLSIPMSMLFAFGTNGTPLKVLATVARIGEAGGGTNESAGYGRVNWDSGDDPSTIYVQNSNQTNVDTGKEVVRIKSNDAATVLNITGNANVGVATDAIGDVAVMGTINQTGSGSTLNCASGLTLTNFYQTAGTATLRSAPGTLVRCEGGRLTTYGDYTLPALTIANATITANHRKLSAGNEITTLTLYDGSILDLSLLSDAFAIGTIVVNGDCRIIRNKATPAHVTWTTLTLNAGKLYLE